MLIFLVHPLLSQDPLGFYQFWTQEQKLKNHLPVPHPNPVKLLWILRC